MCALALLWVSRWLWVTPCLLGREARGTHRCGERTALAGRGLALGDVAWVPRGCSWGLDSGGGMGPVLDSARFPRVGHEKSFPATRICLQSRVYYYIFMINNA